MSYGSIKNLSGHYVKFGFFSVKDWLESVLVSFPTPWLVRPRKGKYYGTVIEDARGIAILSFWECGEMDMPSTREKENFGEWDEESWQGYLCDSHWESETSLSMANMAVEWANFTTVQGDKSDSPAMAMIVENARWAEDCWKEILCGGPSRRSLTPSATQFDDEHKPEGLSELFYHRAMFSRAHYGKEHFERNSHREAMRKAHSALS